MRRVFGLLSRPAPGTPKAIARDMITRAQAARDAGRFAEAAILYSEALRIEPGRARVHVQCGHMFKESGDHAQAEAHYRAAAELKPDDADLALQFGHLYKSAGKLALAEAAYRRAAALKPGWDEPVVELERIGLTGWRPNGPAAGENAQPEDFGVGRGAVPAHAADAARLAPELVIRHPAEHLHGHSESIEVRRLGRRERSYWGVVNTLRGIEAIRGSCISPTPIVDVQILINGQLIHRGTPKGGYALPYEGENLDRRKYVFNVWFDFSKFLHGRYEVEIRMVDLKRHVRSRHEWVVIAAPFEPVGRPDSDGFITLSDESDETLAGRINALPSMVRGGRRALLAEPPRAVLVQRCDQLGDLVVSIPAIRRLRAAFPDARLVGLLSSANAEFGASLKLFDDIVAIDFVEDRWERRRTMSLEAQEALRAKLAAYKFDMAIDLSESALSRPLLLLSGAPFLYGFRNENMPSLNVEVEGNSHDFIDNHEVVPHTNKQVALVEWLLAMLRSEPNLERREDLDRALLEAYGIGPGDRFAVMHDGARQQFSRWRSYPQLAAAILARTDLKVVLITDDKTTRQGLAEDLAGDDRFRLIDERLPFDVLDAMMSFCAVFVGNDSGPKHLAAVRGAKVVSLHMARNNWSEWGQENGGFIISRKVPCAGCLIHYDPEECGRDFVCMTHIKVEEVFEAVAALI